MALARLAAVVLILLPGALFAQSGASPRFDVASVKPVKGEWVYEKQITPLSFTRRGVYIKWLVQFAYGLRQPFQVERPDWIGEGPNVLRFDIYAKTDRPTSEAQMRLMVQSLLADRWKLAI